MPRPPSGRRPGGQPGNVNRLKHGLYSRRLSLREPALAASSSRPSDPEFEIALARGRLVQLLEQQQSASAGDWLSYERAVLHYLGLISSLIQSNARRQRRGLGLIRLLDSLRAHR